MNDFNENQQPPDDDDNNLPEGVRRDIPPEASGSPFDGNMRLPDNIPDFLKDTLGEIAKKFGAPPGGIVVPIGRIPDGLREKVCALCPKMVDSEVAELDMNEMEEWNSINAETDRLLSETDRIHKALDKVDARKAVLCGGLELKHSVAGLRLRIENGKLIKRECTKPKEKKCSLSD